MSDSHYKILQETMEGMFPDFWDICYPRVHRDVGNWHSTKVPAAVLTSGAVKGLTSQGLHAMRNDERIFYMTASLCAKNNFPTYFVTRTLVESVARSSVPDKLKWTDLNMPHPGITWMLPIGALRHPEEGDVAFITLARAKGHEEVKFPFPGAPVGRPQADAMYCVFGCPTHPLFPMYDVSLSAETSPYVVSTANVAKGIDFSVNELLTEQGAEPMTLEQTTWNSNVMAIAFRLLLIMLARPQLITSGGLAKRVTRANKRPTEFWSPTIMGLNYKVRREPSGEPGVSTGFKQLFHYRAGHFKMQPFGVGHSQRKEIWIDDYCAGGNG
jgi:hypothetical protein